MKTFVPGSVEEIEYYHYPWSTVCVPSDFIIFFPGDNHPQSWSYIYHSLCFLLLKFYYLYLNCSWFIMLSSVSGAQQNVTPLFYSCSHFTLGTFIKLTNIVCIVLRFTLFSLCVCVCVCEFFISLVLGLDKKFLIPFLEPFRSGVCVCVCVCFMFKNFF